MLSHFRSMSWSSPPTPTTPKSASAARSCALPRAGLRVGILDLTDGEPTPARLARIAVPRNDRRGHEALGLAWRKNLGLPNRSVQDTARSPPAAGGRLAARRGPRYVFAPYWDDSHPDHVAASRLCEDARFWAKLTRSDLPGEPFWPPRMFYYWSIHLRIHPKPAFVLDISDCIEQKMEAIRRLSKPVRREGRPQVFPTALDDIRDRARYWGWTIGKAYGEPFGSREEIGLNGLEGIV